MGIKYSIFVSVVVLYSLDYSFPSIIQFHRQRVGPWAHNSHRAIPAIELFRNLVGHRTICCPFYQSR